MYLSHFGLREPPFSMTPDPRFLYLSERHREALAHLLYGVSEHGGFVQLTGEVGTGKTSVCRCLLEQLPSQVDVALVLNPQVSPVELLAVVCDELRIAYPPGATSTKVLVDLLHRHLLDAHGRGRRTVVIVDEAQNLAPGVLEEVRLLTNLETSQEKLLQVILIGQPELATLLERPRLRQVAQRITARYHLDPLSRAETRAYIRHRLAVAGGSEGLFSDAAIRLVHRRAGGIPRLVNAICDRALLGAYARGRTRVDLWTAHRAAAEVRGRGRGRRGWPIGRRAGATALAVAAVGMAAILITPGRLDRGARAPAAGAGVPSAEPIAATGAAPAAGVPAGASLEAALGDPALAAGRREALAALFALWGDRVAGGPPPDCWLPAPGGLECVTTVGTWRKLRRLDLPAVLELASPAGEPRYAALVALAPAHATLRLGARELTVPLAEVDRWWDGRFVILWRPPAVPMPIGPGARGAAVDWVHERLSRLEGLAAPRPVPGGRAWDDALQRRLVRFQQAQGLQPDGVVGWETAILLQGAGSGDGGPRLSATASPGA
jgi:general secretion pathway protein A